MRRGCGRVVLVQPRFFVVSKDVNKFVRYDSVNVQ